MSAGGAHQPGFCFIASGFMVEDNEVLPAFSRPR
jgi:hypothetical protein